MWCAAAQLMHCGPQLPLRGRTRSFQPVTTVACRFGAQLRLLLDQPAQEAHEMLRFLGCREVLEAVASPPRRLSPWKQLARANARNRHAHVPTTALLAFECPSWQCCLLAVARPLPRVRMRAHQRSRVVAG